MSEDISSLQIFLARGFPELDINVCLNCNDGCCLFGWVDVKGCVLLYVACA